MLVKRTNKIKCAHCQEVHHRKFQCKEIMDLKTFCGHDQWQKQQEKKEARRKQKVAL